MNAARFPLTPRPRRRARGPVAWAADIPLALEQGTEQVMVVGVLIPGAASSVLPHSVGLRLGATWAKSTIPIAVPGRRQLVPVIPLTLRGIVGTFPPATLVFAWAATDDVPLLLGQLNFFQQFDVCFHHARAHVEVRSAERSVP